jgi:hypothetical protein
MVLDGNTDKSAPVPKGSKVWTGISAFNRLFSIMANSAEEDFPRKALAEFLDVWTNVWDSPMGSHAQKLDTVVAFYDKHAHILGQGLWVTTFSSDSLFLFERMVGEKPPMCSNCAGSGECVPNAFKGESHQSGNGNNQSGNGNNQSGNGNKPNKAKPDQKRKQLDGYCASMLIQGKTCDGTCGRQHQPCPSCKKNCSSASNCGEWDQAGITAAHGVSIDKINSAARRNTKFGKKGGH